jgi:hypothetical protein
MPRWTRRFASTSRWKRGDAAIGGQRFAMQTLRVFGAVALLLSAIEIFGIETALRVD